MLFFLAGSEIDIERIRGRVLNRSILGWLVALVAGLAVGIGLGALLGWIAISLFLSAETPARRPWYCSPSPWSRSWDHP